jgi:hypothetical protein
LGRSWLGPSCWAGLVGRSWSGWSWLSRSCRAGFVGGGLVGPVLVGPVLVGPVLVGPVLVGPVLVGPVLVGPVLVGPVLVGPVLVGLVLSAVGWSAVGWSGRFWFGRLVGPVGQAGFCRWRVVAFCFGGSCTKGDLLGAWALVPAWSPGGARSRSVGSAGAGSSVGGRFDLGPLFLALVGPKRAGPNALARLSLAPKTPSKIGHGLGKALAAGPSWVGESPGRRFVGGFGKALATGSLVVGRPACVGFVVGRWVCAGLVVGPPRREPLWCGVLGLFACGQLHTT